MTSHRKELTVSIEAAADYPRNIVRHNTYEHSLEAYYQLLDACESRLFAKPADAALDFWEFDFDGKAFWKSCARSLDELKKRLRVGCVVEHKDPRCRFMYCHMNRQPLASRSETADIGARFVHAPHSRERLRITREMLTLMFTYHQVMPEFLDFLCPFGRQQYPQDFHFSGFRQHTRLTDADCGLNIPELGWSGRDIRLCYNLKSVEPSESQPDWPWSIRHCAVYHSFDAENGLANWIVIKGDQLMKNRIKSATDTGGLPETSSFQSIDRAFASTLATHLIFCDWSAESWRWYLNFLEEALQTASRRTLTVVTNPPSSPVVAVSPVATRSIASITQEGLSEKRNKTWPSAFRKPAIQPLDIDKPALPTSRPLPPVTPTSPISPRVPTHSFEKNSGREFSFSDLQRLQFIEEKADEAILVLHANINVLAELKQHYHLLTDSEEWPEELRSQCKTDIARFDRRITNVENDLGKQRLRAETLVRLLANRKSLVYGILEYQNMEASKTLATKAQQSTSSMEVVTRDMHEIAWKTKQETVSMRIITFVTLCFLPGTFISTLMSTEIFQNQSSSSGTLEHEVHVTALRLYITIVLPLTLVTLLIWYAVYWWEKRKERPGSDHIVPMAEAMV